LGRSLLNGNYKDCRGRRDGLPLRSPKIQGIIRAAFRTIDTICMNRAFGMNRTTVAHRAKLLLFFRLLADGPVRRQDFIPVLIGLVHRIHLALVLRAVWVARPAKLIEPIP
jgi:hypothetical protein